MHDLQHARRLGRILTHFDTARRVLDQQTTLGTADMRLLWLFHDGAPRTLREIAEQLGLEQSTVNRQVNTAAAQGLLTKARNTGNEPYRFMTSPAGDQQFEQTLDTTLTIYNEALDVFDDDDRQQFLDLLERYIEAYQRAARPPDDSAR